MDVQFNVCNNGAGPSSERSQFAHVGKDYCPFGHQNNPDDYRVETVLG